MGRIPLFFAGAVCAALLGARTAGAQTALELISSWPSQQGTGLGALLLRFGALHPDIAVTAASDTGGIDADALVRSRMLVGDPPDAFQVGAGREVIDSWVLAGRMQDLSSLYAAEGWASKFPKSMLALLSGRGGTWSVPLAVRRSNLLWFIPSRIRGWGMKIPRTLDDLISACKALQAGGVAYPLALGDNATRLDLWESIALATLGPTGWSHLWSGKLQLNDPRMVKAWDTFGQLAAYANPDDAGLSWRQATDKIVSGDAAFCILGDWAAGYMSDSLGMVPGDDFGWAPSPGTRGLFIMTCDAFGLPKGARHKTASMTWLRFIGSREAQDAFNPSMGTIPARLDADLSKYGLCAQSTARDWKSNTIVGSLVHGMVAPETFTAQLGTVMDIYFNGMSSQAAVNAMQAIACQVRLGS
jgi:glucose/mannose transport system substrate-binding protein